MFSRAFVGLLFFLKFVLNARVALENALAIIVGRILNLVTSSDWFFRTRELEMLFHVFFAFEIFTTEWTIRAGRIQGGIRWWIRW